MTTQRLTRTAAVLASALALAMAACGDDGGGGDSDRPTVVVTTSVLGDVVGELVGDDVEVVTVMPAGASPHDFQASARQAQTMSEADALVVNGGGFEAGLVDLIERVEADGVPTFEALDAVEAHHGDEGHDDEDHDDGHGHSHGDEDPHFFTDPLLMAEAVAELGEFLAQALPDIDQAALSDRVDSYRSELEALHADITDLLSGLADDERVLVTNHDVFGYFAERYGFEVIGTVIPGSSTSGGSAGDLAALAAVVEEAGVPAIFTDASSHARLADTVAREVGDVEVVELHTESLGDAGSGAETYLEMMATNAERIATALG